MLTALGTPMLLCCGRLERKSRAWMKGVRSTLPGYSYETLEHISGRLGAGCSLAGPTANFREK